jgi:hypothetical protein
VTIRLYTDPASGRLYYVDPVTGESRWAPAPPQSLWPREYQEPRAQDYLAPPSEPGPSRRTGVKVALGIGGGLVALMVAAAMTSHASKTPVTLQSPRSDASTLGAGAAPTSGSTSGSETTTRAASSSVFSSSSSISSLPSSESTVAVALAPKPATTAHSTKPALVPKPTHPTTAKPTHTTTASSSKKSGCDPNYTGACVPIASDVDCLGGKGNGPAYVKGPVYVVGRDIYGLDADHDGIGCESG